jgi:hypothetical protein
MITFVTPLHRVVGRSRYSATTTINSLLPTRGLHHVALVACNT